jgi:hypothetical protein
MGKTIFCAKVPRETLQNYSFFTGVPRGTLNNDNNATNAQTLSNTMNG